MTMCRLAADAVGCPPSRILPSSTGIIGQWLPMEKIQCGIAGAAARLGRGAQSAAGFAAAILTTDTRRKSAATRFKLGGQSVTVAGVCKGSGMIGPRLGLHATMLAYLTSDARISPASLRRALAAAAQRSFNAVTIDDQASTNDTAAILASGLGATIESPRALATFSAALTEVCQSLAYQIAADGEGATKVVRIDVRGAASDANARSMARAIANSPLVKCAMNGNDPNWGRILCAAGMCGARFDADRAALKLQNALVFKSGQPAAFNAASVSRLLRAKEVIVELSCGLGKSAATVWTCDLSREYVSINADYHT
jgi:glutamate N-acetyltransferase/amino-acid N-acetyltransferase